MEKVWGELKKIEDQGEQIRSEALNKSKTLIELSKKEAEKLLANSKTCVQEEAQHLYNTNIVEANRSRDEQLESQPKSLESAQVKVKSFSMHNSLFF